MVWVSTLNVLNLKYERLVHNSAKVVPLQVFGKFSLLLPYIVDGLKPRSPSPGPSVFVKLKADFRVSIEFCISIDSS